MALWFQEAVAAVSMLIFVASALVNSKNLVKCLIFRKVNYFTVKGTSFKTNGMSILTRRWSE